MQDFDQFIFLSLSLSSVFVSCVLLYMPEALCGISRPCILPPSACEYVVASDSFMIISHVQTMVFSTVNTMEQVLSRVIVLSVLSRASSCPVVPVNIHFRHHLRLVCRHWLDDSIHCCRLRLPN